MKILFAFFLSIVLYSVIINNQSHESQLDEISVISCELKEVLRDVIKYQKNCCSDYEDDYVLFVKISKFDGEKLLYTLSLMKPYVFEEELNKFFAYTKISGHFVLFEGIMDDHNLIEKSSRTSMNLSEIVSILTIDDTVFLEDDRMAGWYYLYSNRNFELFTLMSECKSRKECL